MRSLLVQTGFTLLIGFFFSASAMAQGPGVVIGSNVAVRAEPSPKSEILVTIEKGKKLTVLEQRGAWLKVRVALDAAFNFDGWVSEKVVSWKGSKKPTPSPTRVVTAPPPAVAPVKPAAPAAVSPAASAAATGSAASASAMAAPTPGPPPGPPATSPLDQFFESSGTAKPGPAIAPPQTVARAPEVNLQTQKLEQTPLPGIDRLGKAYADIGFGYRLYHYKLSNGGATPGELFAYNLPGLGVNLDLGYWFWESPSKSTRAGAKLFYEHGFFRYSTNLQQGGATFLSVNSSSGSDDIRFRLKGDYNFKVSFGQVNVGAEAGFDYFDFNASDVEDVNGPIGVFVGMRTMSVVGGAYGEIPIPDVRSLVVNVGVDAMIYNFVDESVSPNATTGTNPSASIGFLPEISLSWLPFPKHWFKFGYEARFQDYSFSGTGSRAGNTVTDGKVDTVNHLIFARYDYRF